MIITTEKLTRTNFWIFELATLPILNVTSLLTWQEFFLQYFLQYKRLKLFLKLKHYPESPIDTGIRKAQYSKSPSPPSETLVTGKTRTLHLLRGHSRAITTQSGNNLETAKRFFLFLNKRVLK